MNFSFVQTRFLPLGAASNPHTDYADFADEHGKSKIRVIRVPKRVVIQLSRNGMSLFWEKAFCFWREASTDYTDFTDFLKKNSV